MPVQTHIGVTAEIRYQSSLLYVEDNGLGSYRRVSDSFGLRGMRKAGERRRYDQIHSATGIELELKSRFPPRLYGFGSLIWPRT